MSKGQGLSALQDRVTNSGHAEFVLVAVNSQGVFSTISNYEQIIEQNNFGYLPSKPPGTLLFYEVTNFLASLTNTEQLPFEKFIVFSSILWPIMAYFVLAFIYLLAKEYFDDETALSSMLLFVSIPSVNLINMHTDQIIYPLLAVIPLLFSVVGIRKNILLLSFLSGSMYYWASFFSFGLLVIGVFYLIPFLYLISKGYPNNLRLALFHIFSILFGILSMGLITAYTIRYNIYIRYTNAMLHHLSWKGWENSLEVFVNANLTNLIEYSVWIGLPITFFIFSGIFNSTLQAFKSKPKLIHIWGFTLGIVFLLLLLIGKTKAETARLWLFLLPFICILVADYINQLKVKYKSLDLVLIWVLVLEFITTCLTLRFQDFF